MASMKPKNQYSSDFVAFLRSPSTKRIEYEVRITSELTLIEELEELLKEKNIVYRKTPIEVFPPPVGIVVGESSIVDCLAVLLTWYARNKDKNVSVNILHGGGDIIQVNTENDIKTLINLTEKK